MPQSKINLIELKRDLKYEKNFKLIEIFHSKENTNNSQLKINKSNSLIYQKKSNPPQKKTNKYTKQPLPKRKKNSFEKTNIKIIKETDNETVAFILKHITEQKSKK